MRLFKNKFIDDLIDHIRNSDIKRTSYGGYATSKLIVHRESVELMGSRIEDGLKKRYIKKIFNEMSKGYQKQAINKFYKSCYI